MKVVRKQPWHLDDTRAERWESIHFEPSDLDSGKTQKISSNLTTQMSRVPCHSWAVWKLLKTMWWLWIMNVMWPIWTVEICAPNFKPSRELGGFFVKNNSHPKLGDWRFGREKNICIICDKLTRWWMLLDQCGCKKTGWVDHSRIFYNDTYH